MPRSLLREPVVHFLLLGAALFAFDTWFRPVGTPTGPTEIVVSEARVRSLAQNFRRTWQRPPTREELDGLVEAHVREEVLYREAIALGLDRDDAIVRRRMQQKMEFVLEETATLAKPTEEELEAYLRTNADAFRTEPRATFVHVYLDPDKRGHTLATDADRMIEALNRADPSADPPELGDRLLLLDQGYDDLPQGEIARLFGTAFAEELSKQPVGRWVGPIRSGYGVHLVRLDALKPGGAPALDDVRTLVEREWASAKRRELDAAFYDRLRAKYAVRIRMPGEAGP